MLTFQLGDITKKNNQKSKGWGMDGKKAAEAFFRCIVSMSNLEVEILLSGHLSPFWQYWIAGMMS